MQTNAQRNVPANHAQTELPKRFKVDRVPDEFMYSNATVESCLEIIDGLLRDRINQDKLDTLHDKYVEAYYAEMSEFFKEINSTPQCRKSLCHAPKPYWNSELSELWKLYFIAEKVFVNMRKDDPRYDFVTREFRQKRRAFEKKLRSEKRSYLRRQVYDLEKANTSNPSEFWRTIENLGPKKKRKIPTEVLLEDGSVSDIFDDVLSKWRRDFQELLTPPIPNSAEQQEFSRLIAEGNEEAEASWSNERVNTDTELNVPITKNEIYTVLAWFRWGDIRHY